MAQLAPRGPLIPSIGLRSSLIHSRKWLLIIQTPTPKQKKNYTTPVSDASVYALALSTSTTTVAFSLSVATTLLTLPPLSPDLKPPYSR